MSRIKGKFARSYDDFIRRNSPLPDGLSKLVASFNPQKIADFGCGTGRLLPGRFRIQISPGPADPCRPANQISIWKEKRAFQENNRFPEGVAGRIIQTLARGNPRHRFGKPARAAGLKRPGPINRFVVSELRSSAFPSFYAAEEEAAKWGSARD